MMILITFIFTALVKTQDDAERQVRELVEMLRSDKIDDRDRAAKELKALGKASLPELEKAAKSSDKEVSVQAAGLLKWIRLRGGSIRLAAHTDQSFHRELVEIEPSAQFSLRSAWVDPYGHGYTLETRIHDRFLNEFLQKACQMESLPNAKGSVSEGTTWTLEVKSGDETIRWSVYAPEFLKDKRYSEGIEAILEFRNRHLASAKPAAEAPTVPGSLRPELTKTPSLMLPAIAKRLATSLLGDEINPNTPMWVRVLSAGHHRNVEIVEAMIGLLDHPDPRVVGAACASLAWASGRPPSADVKGWKAWWRDARSAYAPKVEEHGIGTVGNGKVHVLARYVGGLSIVDIDRNGEIHGAIVRNVGSNCDVLDFFAYEPNRDEWVDSSRSVRIQRSHAYRPDDRFAYARLLTATKMEVPLLNEGNDGIAVSRDNRAAVAVVLGREAYQSLALIDFSAKSQGRILTSDNQFACPVLSEDGRVVAVAEGRRWSDPHGVALYDRDGKLVARPDIPKSKELTPIGFALDNVYFYRRGGENYFSFEIWKYALSTKRAEIIYQNDKKLIDAVREQSRIRITTDGKRILLYGGTGPDSVSRTWRLGFLDLAGRRFIPVSFSGDISEFCMSEDGSRVVYIMNGEVFEWRRE